MLNNEAIVLESSFSDFWRAKHNFFRTFWQFQKVINFNALIHTMYKFVAITPAEVVKLWRGILRVLESAPDTPQLPTRVYTHSPDEGGEKNPKNWLWNSLEPWFSKKL
jgi:hypothetical protein